MNARVETEVPNLKESARQIGRAIRLEDRFEKAIRVVEFRG
jgi:hypothetical protein